MARLNDLGTGKLEAPKLDPLIIKIRPGFNYRDTSSPEAQAHINWLEQSIRERGVQSPIEVEYTNGEVFLVDGECRLTAAQRLRKQGVDLLIPAIPVRGDEADVLARAVLANGGLPPTVLEFGKAAERLLSYGWTEDKISRFVPPSITRGDARKALKFTQDAIELHHAPLEVKKAVAEGVDGVKVSPALAVAATKKNRLQAGEIIKEEVAKAKSAGKKVAARPKGAGKATKAKAVKAQSDDKLMRLGDKMSALILGEHTDYEALEKAANAWNKARV
jgi:ParB-like chromosome segregation protein Spo0J